MNQVLVIGMGYLGSAVARLAERLGMNVTRATLTPEEEGVFAVDLGNKESVEALAKVVPAPDAIILTASTSRGGIEAYKKVFVEGSKHILSAFPKSRVVMCSSSSVYEATDGREVTEEDILEPQHETVCLLREAEDKVLGAGGVVARLSNLYGPGRSVFLSQILDKSAIIEAGGEQWVNHIHRDDAASALLLLAAHPDTAGQIYNVTDNMPTNRKKLSLAVSLLVNAPCPPISKRALPDRKRPWTNKSVTNNKLKSLGWCPAYLSFLEAVPDIAPTLPGYEVRDITDDYEDEEGEREGDDEDDINIQDLLEGNE